jgi:hypothetical protein
MSVEAKSTPSKVQATEVTYELHSLGWKAFQTLCVTIVGEVCGQTVQGFFDSHDGGRDGAFQGTWKPKSGEVFEGSFTAQCKFTSKADKQIQLADLKDELGKAKRLATRGLADNYFLFTNARLTGTNEELNRDDSRPRRSLSFLTLQRMRDSVLKLLDDWETLCLQSNL